MINNINTTTPKSVPFKGALDGVVTNTLRTLDTNPMANAVGIDLFAMVAPRTYVDTKERNKYAGAETFFREFTGTLIVCLSASWFAKMISHAANKFLNPETPINPNSWFSNDSLNYLRSTWENTKNTKSYVTNILDDISGRDGKETRKFKNIEWDKIDWIDEKKWAKFDWDDEGLEGVHSKLKDKNSIISTITNLIDNKELTPSDSKKLQNIIELRSMLKQTKEDIIMKVIATDKAPAAIGPYSQGLEHGNMVFKGTISDFNAYMDPSALTTIMHNATSDEEFMKIEGIERVERLTRNRIRLHFLGDDSIVSRVVKASCENGWQLREIFLETESLDKVFAQLSGKSFK